MKHTARIITVIGIAVALMLVGFIVTFAIMEVAPQENKTRVHATVKAVCDYSRQSNNFDPCYKAQDASHTEYICYKNTCWVEEM